MAHDRIFYNAAAKKTQRRNFGRRMMLVTLILIFIALNASGLYAIRHPRWQISRVEISGLETLDKETIIASLKNEISGNYFFFAPKASFFLIRTQTLSSQLANKFLKIESLSIAKKFPDTINVSLKERKLWGIFCNNLSAEKNPEPPSDNSCVFIDTNGFAFGQAPDSRGSLIVKIKSDGSPPNTGNQIIPKDMARTMQYVSREIASRMTIETTGYELITKLPSEFRAITADGFRIYMNRNDDFENTFRVLAALFQGELKDKKTNLAYIDARFGNKVFYKMK